MVTFVLRTATASYPNQIEVEGNLVLSYPFQIRAFSKISLCNHELICFELNKADRRSVG